MRDMEPKDQQLTVALRIRPLNDTEQEEGATVIAHKVGDQAVVLMDPGEDPEGALRTHRSREKTFIFDAVFDQHASQEGVYCATTQRLVDGVVSGYNATVFAYGPSGAGKTYTMLGMDAEPGIYLQTLTDLFRAIEQTRGSVDSSVSMSYLEIYNEVIRDLLSPSSGPLDLREDARGSIQVAGITEVSTSNAQEIMQLLTRGNRQRTQEPTAANRTSSRSHAVLQVTVRQQGRGHHLAEGVRVGRLFLVDLAGSERASQTQNRGKRMQEGAHINRSLLALGNCINALSERGGGRTQYVNFRDSKLTRLLKDALGGNSRTVMIAHISPASTSFEESRSTLLYAHRAKSIKTRVKRNLLTVSYHLDQDTDVISDLRRQIAHLKSKIERQEQRRSEPGLPDARVAMPAQDPEEDSRLQMSETRAQLAVALQTQPEMRRSLVGLEDANIELHVDVSRHLLAIADWDREKTPHHVQDEAPERDEQQAVADAAGDEGESAEPHEGALAGEEVSLLLAAQRKTVALQAELERCLASPQRKAAQLERQAGHLRGAHLLAQRDLLIGRLCQHWLLSERIIRDQRQLIQDAGLPVPAALDERYGLYARALGEGSLDRLLLLHSATTSASSLPDGSVGNTSPAPEEARGDQDDRKGPLGSAPFELPQMLLETDRDGFQVPRATPCKQRGRQAAPGPPPLHALLTPPAHEGPSALRAKPVVSRLSSPAGPDLEEVAASTKSIALVAASRCCQAQDREGGSGRSSLHLPEELAPHSRDTSPADRRRPRASPCREGSAERKARSRRSPGLSRCSRPATEEPQPPSPEHLAVSQTPLAPHQLSKSSGLFPAVPAASKTKPGHHAGSADSGGRGRSPLPPSSPHRPWGRSAKGPRGPL